MGAARLVEDGVNGLITPSGDPSALAAAMHRLAGDAELRVRMGKAAAESAKRFEYQLVGEERARILRDLLESRAPQKTVA
jgi:glycosyltransferase involved in cell wall biosynthesis